MSRIYDDRESIDAAQVREFFNGRASKEQNPLNAVMLQPSTSTLPTQRDDYEKAILIPRPAGQAKILDLGCGAGRLASLFLDKQHSYLGLDFSDELIAIAKTAFETQENIDFAVAELPHVSIPALPIEPPFDHILITGLFIYLNDEAVRDTFSLIARLAAPKARLYIRESLSDMDVRLTLKEHFSEELGETYNAIYRTTAELKAVIEETLVSAGFRYEVCGDYAFPPELRNRAETAQRYFTLARD